MGKRRPLRYRGVSNARIDSWQPFLSGMGRALKDLRVRQALYVAVAGAYVLWRVLGG